MVWEHLFLLQMRALVLFRQNSGIVIIASRTFSKRGGHMCEEPKASLDEQIAIAELKVQLPT